MNIINKTQESLGLAKMISETVFSFHSYHHILYDIAALYGNAPLIYAEIGCYAGASACLMLQRPNTTVFSIDRGKPVKRESAEQNVARLNIHKNRFEYIEGSSGDFKVAERLREKTGGKIDILFIDGSHRFADVISDFIIYGEMVKPGGFIVFDDYDDIRCSPEVKKAVDYMCRSAFFNFDIHERFQNEFIIRKKNGNK